MYTKYNWLLYSLIYSQLGYSRLFTIRLLQIGKNIAIRPFQIAMLLSEVAQN